MRNQPTLPYILCLLVLLSGGCSTAPSTPDQRPALNRDLFGQSTQIPDAGEVFELSEQQIEALNEFLKAHEDDSDLHWQLARFIEDYLSGFDYWGRTLTASQALQGQQGNCMSLAIVTAAFSRQLGLEHDFQLMRTPPTFERSSDLVVVSDHVRTRIYPPATDQPDEDSGHRIRRAIIDYFPDRERFPSRGVSNDELLGMFYRNLAAEHLLDDDINSAFWFAEHADMISPENASVLNLLAIIHRRAGDARTAEALFSYALQHHPDDVNVLHNLQTFLESQGRQHEAEEISARLARVPDQNPYPRLLLARQLASDGQLGQALKIYQSITKQLPYVHEAYWGIATVRHLQGDQERAREAMETALELARAPLHQRLYTAKLHALDSELPGVMP